MHYLYLILDCLLIAGLFSGCGNITIRSGLLRSELQHHFSLQTGQEDSGKAGSESDRDYRGIVSEPADDSTTLPDCDWRRCEISGTFRCDETESVCDMYRNLCVPLCTGNNCCDNADCPEGTVCITALGCCGIPSGEGCYDLGTEWWSGRDIQLLRPADLKEAIPAVFEVYNDGMEPLYFISSPELDIRFDLYLLQCRQLKELPLEVNQFCATLCPEQGPPMETDCDQPPSIMHRLPAGGHLTIIWSGMEQVGMWRFCKSLPLRYCKVDRVTLPGIYTLEICAYPTAEGGRPYTGNPDLLLMAKPAGERKCFRARFQHPSTTPVVIRFGS